MVITLWKLWTCTVDDYSMRSGGTIGWGYSVPYRVGVWIYWDGGLWTPSCTHREAVIH